MNLQLSARPKHLPSSGIVLSVLQVSELRTHGLSVPKGVWWFHHDYSIKKARSKPGHFWVKVRQDLDTIAGELMNGEPVFVHCAAGIHRTGTNAWAILKRTGMSDDEAVSTVISLRPAAHDFVRFIPWAKSHLLK